MITNFLPTISRFSLQKNPSEFESIKITDSKTGADFIRRFYGDDIEIFESCFVLLLDRGNNTIGFAKISQGGITGTVVDVRLIAKYAVESLACSVMLAHNHPSGTLRPSESDRDITNKVKQGLKVLDIVLLDHFIITSNGYYSFADNGQLY